jgi:hypothetical protein
VTDRSPFNPLQAQQVAEAFNAAGAEYLLIGKSGAIILGYPGTTQDVAVFPQRSPENGRRLVSALIGLGFDLDASTQADIVRGKDFVQLKNGPFDIDLVFAPDGIESYAVAKSRAVREGIFPVANLRDIIASKRASGRMKDRLDLHLLELFRLEYESRPGSGDR